MPSCSEKSRNEENAETEHTERIIVSERNTLSALYSKSPEILELIKLYQESNFCDPKSAEDIFEYAILNHLGADSLVLELLEESKDDLLISNTRLSNEKVLMYNSDTILYFSSLDLCRYDLDSNRPPSGAIVFSPDSVYISKEIFKDLAKSFPNLGNGQERISPEDYMNQKLLLLTLSDVLNDSLTMHIRCNECISGDSSNGHRLVNKMTNENITNIDSIYVFLFLTESDFKLFCEVEKN